MGDAGLLYKVSGLGEMSDLADIRSKRDAQYEGVTLLAILSDLLSRAPGWLVGDTSTMIDAAVVTTVNLQDEERLFPQITKAIGSVPGCYFRYG